LVLPDYNNMYGIVYCAINRFNGKIYIGKSYRTLKERVKDHKGHYTLKKTYFHKEMSKIGFNNFSWKVLDYANTKEELSELETYYIDFFGSNFIELGYNISIGTYISEETRNKFSNSSKGRIFSEETKKKISEAHLGKKASLETRKKMSVSFTGRILSEETRKRMGISRMGNNNHPKRSVICLNTNKVYSSTRLAEKETGVDHSSIIKCCKGKIPHAGFLNWAYYTN
jgi:group I intron endonuclease